MKRSIAIIGGGISGLAASHRLIVRDPDLDVVIFERESRLGGKILTERRDGYVIEAGPDAFLSVKPRGEGLSREMGLADRLIGPDERNRGAFVLLRGRLVPIPEGLTGLVPSRLTPIFTSHVLSPLGKLRMAGDLVIGPSRSSGDESLASFVERRLGREAYARLIEPLISGIYAGDGRQLSLAATFPNLRTAERRHGGMIRGAVAVRKEAALRGESQSSKRGFLSFPDGMAELVEALQDRIAEAGCAIRTETTVLAIHAGAHGVSGYDLEIEAVGRTERHQTGPFDGVIIATPAWAAAPLVKPWSGDAADGLSGIPHVSNAIVVTAFPAPQCPHRLQGTGYVVPRVENRPVMAVTWSSSKWRDRAPAGHVLIRAFIGRSGQQQELHGDDASLTRIALTELRNTLGVTGEPEFSRVFRWDKGMPQYNLGHLERVDRIEIGIGKIPGIEIAGNMFRGVGIPDCIASGEAAADKTLAWLRELQPTAQMAGSGR